MKDNLKDTEEHKIRVHSTIKRARSKTGQDKFSKSISFPKKQIEWLDHEYKGRTSELITRLLGDYIETSEKTQPTAIKVYLHLKTLKGQLENTKLEFGESARLFFNNKGLFEKLVGDRDVLRQLSIIPEDQLKISCDELNTPKFVSISGNGLYISLEHYGRKERDQVIKRLRNESAMMESAEYQSKIDILEHQTKVAESVYNAYKQNLQLIEQQIAEIEKQLIG